MLEENITNAVKEIINKESQNQFLFEKKKLFNILGDELTKSLKEHKAFVAGGFITSLFCNRNYNDVDIYFRNKFDAGTFFRNFVGRNYHIKAHTNKATLFTYQKLDLQVIHFDYFDNVDNIFDKFDFTVCMGAFDFQNDRFVLHPDFLKHNAQRLLKFNERTCYPVISALRVQKYLDKGYTISKPEFIKIALTCASLNVNTYAELKDHIGGMYGINYDKIIAPKDGELFNLMNCISKFTDITFDDDYFKPVEQQIPNDVSVLANEIDGLKTKVFNFNGTDYTYDEFEFDILSNTFDEKYYERVSFEDVIKFPYKFYKFVQKHDDEYRSYFDNSFKYIVGECARAKTDAFDKCHGLHGGAIQNYYNFPNSNAKDAVMLELEIDNVNQIIDISDFRVKEAKVIRVVPKEEYENVKSKNECPFD